MDSILTPRDFYELYKFVTVTSDMMFVNGISFLGTLSRDIIIFNAEHLSYREGVHLSSSLTKLVKTYARRGFIVHVIFIDMESEKVSNYLDIFQVNTTVAIYHIGEIGRVIRVIKE